jgi:peptidoglycan/LPS O-acetylase OafA/YrhL
MRYRPEIDGLRAIAVLPVIFFHAGWSLFQGGYVGVDIFFVISGYLITSIIAEDLAQKKFSIQHFYERRARRILPALFFVMLCCLPFAWQWMTPHQLKSFAQSLVAVSGFSSNILFFLTSGYFDSASELKPLLHTWSLAVEEQYYMVFPLLLMAIWRFKHNKVLVLLSGLFVLSLLCAEWGWRNNTEANFYLLPMRGWELLAGAILALHMGQYNKDAKAVQKGSNLLSVVGLALVFGSLFFFDKSIPHPSLYTIFPVLGTLLIIYSAQAGTWVARLLSFKPILYIGLISYSLYLWHQPLFVFARLRLGEHLNPEIYAALIIAAIGLAWFNYQFVERPFRNKKAISVRQIFVFSALGSLLFIALGFYGHVKQGFPERFGEEGKKVLAQVTRPAPFMTGCLKDYSIKDKSSLFTECQLGNKPSSSKPNIILLGDSHAASLAYGLDKALHTTGYNGLQLTVNGCPPIKNMTRADNLDMRDVCPRAYNVAEEIYLESKPHYVIVSSRWALQLTSKRFNNQDGGIEHGGDAEVSSVEPKDNLRDVDLSQRYVQHFEALNELYKQSNTTLIVISQIPEAGWNVPDRALSPAYRNLKGDAKLGEIKTRRSVYDERNVDVERLMQTIEKLSNVKVLYPADALCDAEFCYNTENGIPLYRDDDHLSMLGSEKLGRFIAQHLKD